MPHRGRPDPAEMKDRLMACRVSHGAVQDGCEPDRAVDIGPDPVVEDRARPAMREIGRGCETSAVQGNRHALAGKGWNDADLIAQPEQALRLVWVRRVEKAIGDLEDGQRPLEQPPRALLAFRQMRTFADDAIEKGVPAFADLFETLAGNDEAEIGDILLDHL